MILADELRNDPAARGYAAHLPNDPQRAADLLGTVDFAMVKPITSARALTWAASGPMAIIVDASANAAHPARASCLAFMNAVSAGMDLGLNEPDVRAAFDGWLTLGVITSAQFDALMAMATKPASRAEVLGIPAPSARDIIDAWDK